MSVNIRPSPQAKWCAKRENKIKYDFSNYEQKNDWTEFETNIKFTRQPTRIRRRQQRRQRWWSWWLVCAHSVNVRSNWINHWTGGELHHLIASIHVNIFTCISSHRITNDIHPIITNDSQSKESLSPHFLRLNRMAFVFECDKSFFNV